MNNDMPTVFQSIKGRKERMSARGAKLWQRLEISFFGKEPAFAVYIFINILCVARRNPTMMDGIRQQGYVIPSICVKGTVAHAAQFLGLEHAKLRL